MSLAAASSATSTGSGPGGCVAAFNGAALDPSVRVFGPNASVAQDLEPEYITISHDSRTAWVTLQEANAIAELDIVSRSFVRLAGLGFKDHSKPENAFDPSDRDPGIRIGTWPVFGMYQPDAIVSFREGDETFLAMANEGDSE